MIRKCNDCKKWCIKNTRIIIEDDNTKEPIETYYVCSKCTEHYKILEIMIKSLGPNGTVELLNKILKGE